MARAEVTAVYEDDALELLELLGVAAAFHDGTLRCSICAAALRENGLGAVRSLPDDSIEFACSRAEWRLSRSA